MPEWLEPRNLLTFTPKLVADINQDPAALELPSLNFTGLAVAGGNAFFATSNPSTGPELWKTDGTGAGTQMVKDIFPGMKGSYPSQLTSVGTSIFFVANDGVHGNELWNSDGTEAGTVLVEDIHPGVSDSSVVALTNVNGTLFFRARTNEQGYELWKSDGTAGGTVLVKDIRPGTGSSQLQDLTNINGTLFFKADDGTHGFQLWKSDGTATGTTAIANINPGVSVPNPIVEMNGKAFFVANAGTSGSELYVSDGTAGGTQPVKDFRPGSGGPSISYLTNVNGTLFFRGNDGLSGNELWKSDGTPSGTVLVKDILTGAPGSSPAQLTNVNGLLYFMANDGTNGYELWKSDGTTSGTVMVKDIKPWPGYGSIPRELTNVNGSLFFVANDGTHGDEVWKTDGTDSGTVMVDELLFESAVAGHPDFLVNLNGTLLYRDTASRPFDDNGNLNGPTLWRSDATATGTFEVAADAISTRDAFLGGNTIIPAGNIAFLITNDGRGSQALWKTDGTMTGTVLVKQIPQIDLYTGTTPVNVNGTLFFRASDGVHGHELWESDGTSTGTFMVKDIRTIPDRYSGFVDSNPSYLTNVNGTLLFVANDGVHGEELWRSDGTEAGTVMVKDIRPGAIRSRPRELTEMNGRLFFDANNGSSGYELWMSDGTESGTVMVKDIFPVPSNSSNPSLLTNADGTLFFGANDGVHGNELWMSDGTQAGTIMVKDIWPGEYSRFGISGPYSSVPVGLTNVNGTVFFEANDGKQPGGLWKSDGTEQGTVLVKAIPGGTFANYGVGKPSADFDGRLLLVGADPVHGKELWTSDGTDAGTEMVKEIWPGSTGSNPLQFTILNGIAFFTASKDSGAPTLWETDGTNTGTVEINAAPGDPLVSRPKALTVFGGQLFFTAYDPIHGRELRTLVFTNTAPTAHDDAFSTSEDVSLVVQAPGLLQNDTDVDVGDTKGITSVNGQSATVGMQVTLASGALITVSSDGGLIYDPNNSFETLGVGQTATDSFVYTMSDGHGATSSATVTITVGGANDPPVAVNDTAITSEDDVLEVPPSGVLTNDFDIDSGDTKSVTAVNGQAVAVGQQLSLPSGAVLTAQANGSYRYDPSGQFDFLRAGQTATDSFIYTMADSAGAISTATVTVTVQGLDDPPSAEPDKAVVNEDAVLSVDSPGVLANDSDVEGDPLSAVLETGPSRGSLTFRTDGSYVYTPAADFHGNDTFTYRASDGQATSGLATVTITVQPVNDAPSGTDAVVTTFEDVVYTFQVADFGFTDPSDVPADDLKAIRIDSLPAVGKLTNAGAPLSVGEFVSLGALQAGALAYNPPANANGMGLASFTLQVQDNGGTALGGVDIDPTPNTISINVTPVNDPPVVSLPANVGGDEGSVVSFTGSFADPDIADSWTATVDYGDGLGSFPVLVNSDKTFQVVHSYADNGSFTVTVSVNDSGHLVGLATSHVLVNNVPPQNLILNGPLFAVQGQSLSFSGSFTDLGAADTHTAIIDWDDGSSSSATLTGVGVSHQISASHTYATGGIFHVVLTVTDDDGGSATLSTTVLVGGARITQKTLEIVGTIRSDALTLNQSRGRIQLSGSLGPVRYNQSFAMQAVTHVIASLGEGNDTLTISTNVKLPALIDGGAGNDHLTDSGGSVVIVGGDGNDVLVGGNRRSVLIGGTGADRLIGGNGSDLLIAGPTAYDQDHQALLAIQAEWNSARSLSQRMANLSTGSGPIVGPMNVKLVTNQTVFDDGAVDILFGGGDLDWYFGIPQKDKFFDRTRRETIS